MLASSFDNIIGLPLDTTLTIRLATIERTRLDSQAKALGISTAKYVRLLIADEVVQRKLAVILERRNRQADYAQILMALGKSRIANNLNQIAYAINSGSFMLTPDVVSQINEAYFVILEMKETLLKMQGLR